MLASLVNFKNRKSLNYSMLILIDVSLVDSLSRIITENTDVHMKSDQVATVVHEHYKQKINSKRQKIHEANNQFKMFVSLI